MVGDSDSITLTKGTRVVKLDVKIHTPKGVLYGLYFKRLSTEVASVAVKREQSNEIGLSIEKLHRQLGHLAEDSTRATAAVFGIKLT